MWSRGGIVESSCCFVEGSSASSIFAKLKISFTAWASSSCPRSGRYHNASAMEVPHWLLALDEYSVGWTRPRSHFQTLIILKSFPVCAEPQGWARYIKQKCQVTPGSQCPGRWIITRGFSTCDVKNWSGPTGVGRSRLGCKAGSENRILRIPSFITTQSQLWALPIPP